MGELALLEGQGDAASKKSTCTQESVCCAACPYHVMEIIFNSKITGTKIFLTLVMSRTVKAKHQAVLPPLWYLHAHCCHPGSGSKCSRSAQRQRSWRVVSRHQGLRCPRKKQLLHFGAETHSWAGWSRLVGDAACASSLLENGRTPPTWVMPA